MTLTKSPLLKRSLVIGLVLTFSITAKSQDASTKACHAGLRNIDLSDQFPAPKFQGDTGTCYLFESCGLLESTESRNTGNKPRALSESYLALKVFSKNSELLKDAADDYWKGDSEGVLSAGHTFLMVQEARKIGRIPTSTSPEKEAERLKALDTYLGSHKDPKLLKAEVKEGLKFIADDLSWGEDSKQDFSKTDIRLWYQNGKHKEKNEVVAAKIQHLRQAQASIDDLLADSHRHLEMRAQQYRDSLANPSEYKVEAEKNLARLKSMNLEDFAKEVYGAEHEVNPQFLVRHGDLLKNLYESRVKSREEHLKFYTDQEDEHRAKIATFDKAKELFSRLANESIEWAALSPQEFENATKQWSDEFCQEERHLWTKDSYCQQKVFSALNNMRTHLRIYQWIENEQKNGKDSLPSNFPTSIGDINNPQLAPKDFDINDSIRSTQEECRQASSPTLTRIMTNLCNKIPVGIGVRHTGTALRPSGEEWKREAVSEAPTLNPYSGHGLIIQGHEYDSKTGEGYFVLRNSWEETPTLRISTKDSCMIFTALTVLGPKDPGYKAPSFNAFEIKSSSH